ncbi:isocitrate lyase family protein [Mycobacterium xenopi 3993]|nr:isocitrate lyase family protein [Mycobacterium xenopi 3993]
MSDDEMRRFPEELGKMGFVFNFITYGGHQIDGVAAEEFATALKQDGMLALARLQRQLRLVESPYRTPQTLVGGPAVTPRCWHPRDARPPPRPWVRVRRSTSIWCRPRCPRSCSRTGWRCGASTTSLAKSSVCNCDRTAPVLSCSSSASSVRATRNWPT